MPALLAHQMPKIHVELKYDGSKIKIPLFGVGSTPFIVRVDVGIVNVEGEVDCFKDQLIKGSQFTQMSCAILFGLYIYIEMLGKVNTG